MVKKGERLGLVLAVYLLGLLIGGLYVGMVSPVRTVIQAHFGIDGATGIWMINIYTLFYAALIPVIGSIAVIPASIARTSNTDKIFFISFFLSKIIFCTREIFFGTLVPFLLLPYLRQKF